MKFVIKTAEGDFLAHYSERGLARLEFPSTGRRREENQNGEGKVLVLVRDWHDLTVKALQAALAGRTPSALPPLDLTAGTDFQRKVWNALRRIAAGKTKSYAAVAAAIGKPKACRAVGGACGANPIPVLVPCHRVLAANQQLGGFSGGLNWKRLLLGREGVGLELT